MLSDQSGPSSGSRSLLATAQGRPILHLLPAQLQVSAEPSLVVTILGSCVAVNLWDPALRFGGVNHFLLPFKAAGHRDALRFGNLATEKLVAGMCALGCQPRQLRAKLFGGAHTHASSAANGDSLGARNAMVALETLAKYRIPVVARDLGGNQGRKLLVQTDTGTAWVRRL